MIHHISFPAREPKRVAEVLAELIGGMCLPFFPHEGAFMAVSGDAHGSLIEVYPEGTGLAIPSDDGQVCFTRDEPTADHWPFHFLLSVGLDEPAILRIGAREGWRTKTFGRGPAGAKPFFHVIELWVENRFMVELSTPTMTREYLALVKERFHEAEPATI
jgi:hypothetical protein